MVLTFTVFLANICRSVMETVSVLPFAKFRENRKNIWRKYGENMSNILVLTSFLLALPTLFRYVPPSFVQSFGHQSVYDISVHSLSHMLEQLCCKAFVINFGRLHFLNVSP